MKLTKEQVVQAFDGLRRAQTHGVYAPHKPLLVLLALARIQRGEAQLSTFQEIEPKLKTLLTEFGPTGAALRRHLPYWHLSSDYDGNLWRISGPPQLVNRQPGQTPTLGDLRQSGVQAGFANPIDEALRRDPNLLERVALRVLDAYFPKTLHEDIVAEIGLNLLGTRSTVEPGEADTNTQVRRRDPAFRQKVLMAYEYRCCVCGFDLRVGHMPAGLEGAHIQWHTAGGPDTESNGLCLCSLHHKLFDLGAFTIEPTGLRIVFSQQAIAGTRGTTGPLSVHGQQILMPQSGEHRPGVEYLKWNRKNVFKAPGRP